MTTGLRIALVAAIGVALLVSAAQAVQAAKVVSVVVRNPSDKPLKDVPVTFGQVFGKGDCPPVASSVLPPAGSVSAKITVPGASRKGDSWQIDVKRLYDDGSVRFAVISLMIAELPAGGQAMVELFPAGPDKGRWIPPDLLKTDYNVDVRLTFPATQADGAAVTRSIDARKLLSQPYGGGTWLGNDFVTEYVLSGAPMGPDGVPDPDLNVQFQVRAYAGGKYVRTSVVVENCWDTWAGNIGYDVKLTVGKDAKAAFEKKGVDHRRASRWRKVVWWPEEPPQAGVVHDLAYLAASGALPNYDRTIKIGPDALTRMGGRLSGPEFDIMGSGSLTKYMPTTGGRPEIGPYPSWTVSYLLSMDGRAKQLVLANGELAGSWPIHVRARKTGRIMTIDERPKFWFNGYKPEDKERPLWQPDRKPAPDKDSPEGKAYALTPDCAHQSSLAYVPYLVTGDFYYLEEAYFWASWCLLAQWNTPRQDAKGIMSDQIRGNAWGLRNIADAGFIAPDGDPEAKYFPEKVNNTLSAWTAKMLGPPEYNKLGFWGPRTVADARIQGAANPDWLVTAPWEHDYLIWSLHHLTELGYAEAARPRDFELRWRVGAFLHPDEFDPGLAAPYRMVVGERRADKKTVFYEDWKKLGEENAKLNKPGLGYDYSAHIALVAGADAGFPQADEALQVLLAKTGGFTRMLADPAWRIMPKKPTTATTAKE